eukprot:COSAG02_NODE_4385_length_5421_cov_4.928035_2_plen_84_part_00
MWHWQCLHLGYCVGHNCRRSLNQGQGQLRLLRAWDGARSCGVCGCVWRWWEAGCVCNAVCVRDTPARVIALGLRALARSLSRV